MCQSRIRQTHGKYFMHAAVRQHYVGVVGKFLPKQFQTPNFLLLSFLCIFGEWGHHGCTHAQGQVAGLCIHISVEPKIKLFTSQAEAACTTQHMGLELPAIRNLLAALFLSSLPEAHISPSGPAVTSPPQQQRWLGGRISWASQWSLWLPTGWELIPDVVPSSLAFIRVCRKYCICGT